jgi:hypothetical protein
MRRSGEISRPGLLVLVLVLLGAGLYPAWAEFQERRSFGADTLTVRNLIGEIQVRGHGGSSFEVRVNVKGSDASPERVRVESEDGSRGELAVVFPLDEERKYVYPKLGQGSRSTFSMSDDGDSWLSKLMGEMLKRRITVSGSGSGMEVWADVEVLVPAGRTLVVKHGVGEIGAESVDGDLTLDTNAGSVTVRSIGGKLVVDTGSGRVSGEDLSGEATIDTGSGGVDVVRFTGDELNIDTGSGSVEIEQIDTRELVVDTGSGSVRAAAIRTDSANLDTGSGGITLRLDRMGPGDFNLDTGSGRIVLVLPVDASADVRASTGSGGIHIDLGEGVRIRQQDRDEVVFTVGGGEARIELDTGSGGIRITRAE